MRLEDCRLLKNTRVIIEEIKIMEYPHNTIIALEGDISTKIGIVLEGKILVKVNSLGGKNFTMSVLETGQIFGDVLIYAPQDHSYPGNLVTQGNTRIAFLNNSDFEKYLFNDNDLLRNFLSLLSDKAYNMNLKSKLLSQDTVRDKILFFLQQQKRVQKNNRIFLHMTKEELANILFVQRPSLSRELGKMKEEGLIDYDRKTITILK